MQPRGEAACCVGERVGGAGGVPSSSSVSEFMNGKTLVTRGYLIPRSSDLWGLRARMIKLLNLPWNPPAMQRGMKQKSGSGGRGGGGRNSGAHSFDGDVGRSSRVVSADVTDDGEWRIEATEIDIAVA